MKKSLLLCAGLVCRLFSYAGDGSLTAPYTVSEALQLSSGKTGYVKGYVAGEMNEFTGNNYFYTLAPPFDGKPNYLLADDPYETDLDKCLPVQFTQATGDTLNLDEYPCNWHKLVAVKGKTGSFFSRKGLLSVTDFHLLSPLPLEDETLRWKFLEDFDRKKSYVPANPDLTFAGGIYTGEEYVWQFTGATLGSSSNDKKWDLASARIRLTEGKTGERGAVYMLSDKPEGIGYIRFWAGHYDTDRHGKLSIWVSSDEGRSWEAVVPEIAVNNQWQEYQFRIDRQGSCRLKIAKAESTDAGINVDNIRLSDYTPETSSVSVAPSEKRICVYPVSGGIRIKSGSEEPADIFVYTLTGQPIRSGRLAENSWETNLPEGCYLIRIGTVCRKVIVR